ncbi:hypothetical protein E0H73_44505 [Kribbella pittospori]|uniref:MFS transporter n=1 Tax=Kribbella pittospori TaxID=722689 RepID=A0A4R0JGE6_9ACTN|nr:hypothetical protein [Kribbella pittospori]TCC45559.1 hypothetical protein E0H73_44505 [Kribbella pittospori]
MVTSAAAFVLLSRAPADNGYATHLLPAFVIAGFTFAAAFVPLTAQGMSGIRDGERGLASGILQTSTHLGGAIVLTALATVATARTHAADGGSSRLHFRLVPGLPHRRPDPCGRRRQCCPDSAHSRRPVWLSLHVATHPPVL